MPPEKILVVDDDKAIRSMLAEALRAWGFAPMVAVTVREAREAFDVERFAVALLDINLPDGSGLDVLRAIEPRHSNLIAVMMTSHVLISDTIAALRAGAYDFIVKPINLEELRVTLHNGLEARALRREVNLIRREQKQSFSFDQIIGDSPTMRDMQMLARKVAASEVSSVLLQGESGTGKDLVAKAIHYASRRAAQPFVAINCAAIPPNLMESELFGYEKGAFTDAKARKEGLFEQAEGGTLFLDEIGELELNLQAKLLRVLEEGAFRRVGGLRDIALDVRVIAAANRDLKAEADVNRFRLDLYYRLSVIQIDIPPLCERGDDVIQLAEHFIKSLDKNRHGKPHRRLSVAVIEAFRRYRWQGNVRELRNVVERSLILEDGDVITTKYLPRGLAHEEAFEDVSAHGSDVARYVRLPPDGIKLETVELWLVEQALERCGGNSTRAAEMLGITRDQLRYRLLKRQHDASFFNARRP